VWFDKPPLTALFYLLCGAQAGWPLRVLDAAYALLACWVAWLFARDLWSEREGLWAAALLGFFLTFDFPAAVIPAPSDLLMLAPHLAAVWMASRGRPFWSGVLAGVAFWVSPKGAMVLAVCALWDLGGILSIAAGFAAVAAVMGAWLWGSGALFAYWDEVWRWGRLYAGSTFIESPVRNALLRTVNWMGFHVALVAAAAWFLWKDDRRVRWLAWLLISAAGVSAGMRFFPRYYFQLLAVVSIMAARGFVLAGRRREFLALLLLIPLTRFGPTYLTALTNPGWRDIAMDRDSRAVSAMVRQMAKPGDTLFIWGYRPEIFTYTGLPSATKYLDSQPLTGVPADRHLTRSEPVETVEALARRRELAASRPVFLLDGLGLFNPHLAIGTYPELRTWFSHYRQVGRTAETVIYRRE
jgi:Glycosyltransferase family 87